jgi:hypothetical protein
VLKIARGVFGLRRFFGTKPFVVVPLPGCSLLVVNKNRGGVSDVDRALNLLKCHVPSRAPTCRPSAEPTAVPSAHMKTKRRAYAVPST